ncbi:MAG: protein kinase [Candidatus Thiodiazotropha sp. 'RUGA']|nr:protein kinase [Candidatus Thiodiazotropha sp. 'RUGA']
MDNQYPMPESIGRFQLVEEVGEGAMSIVYKAFDPEINRPLAIKLLRGECAVDPEYRYRFLQEAKAAGKLTHPNIVTIFDVGEVEQGPYIAMEFLEGQTLEEIMDGEQEITTRDVVIYGIQLAEALDYSHARGIVHRDVKPGNIISPGYGHSLRITDFGIARIDAPNKEHKTRIGSVLGTPQYMSPEQVEGQQVDGRSDLFSLGVILYQLLTGVKPFVSETLTSLLMKIVQEEPAPIDIKKTDIPQSLKAIVEKLLNKNPVNRFQTGKELADALRRVIHEIDEKQQHINESKILPLRIKWTAVMAMVVSLAMILGSYLVYQKQVDTMTELTLDSGGSLADFIAIESAEAVLIQDWVAIETFVQEVNDRQQISYLKIFDHRRVLRASTSLDEVGETLEQSLSGAVLREEGGIVITEAEWQGEEVFDFQAPLIFQNRTIGGVQLGLSQTPLIAAADLTFYTMLGLLLAVVLTVVVVAYLLATGITLPMKILRKAMRHISKGNYAYRIRQERNDELGLMFKDYNRMAEELQNKQQAEAATEDETQSDLDTQTPTQTQPQIEPEPEDDDETRIAPAKQPLDAVIGVDDSQELDDDMDDATRIIKRN